MKKIALSIITLAISINMFAQDRTPVDKIYEDIAPITEHLHIPTKQKINHGDGVVMYVQNDVVGKMFLCTKECGEEYPYDEVLRSYSVEKIDSINNENKKVFDGMFGTFKHHLDSLMLTAQESYHYESHSQGKDTILYSICIKNGADSIRKVKASNGIMIYPDALETLSFNFTDGYKPCGKHISGMGWLSYNKNVFLPDRKSDYFKKEPYLETILPVLKRKGVKSWTFRWGQSDNYDVDKNWREEFVVGHQVDIKGPDGRKSNVGQTSGTMYFIPIEKRALAEDIFTAIDSLTLDHTNIYPEQMFRYTYNVKENVMGTLGNTYISQLFEGTTSDGYHATHVYLGITPEGFYVMIADREKNFWIPREWSVLKSYFDGKKKYINK